MSAYEFLAWVASSAIILGGLGAVFLFMWAKHENQKAVEEFKRKHGFK